MKEHLPRADPDAGQRKSVVTIRRLSPPTYLVLTRRQLPATAADPLADRIGVPSHAACDRFADLDCNLASIAVPSDNSGKPDLALTRISLPVPDE